MSLIDQVPKDYQRPKCPHCHWRMSFIHVKPGGERYACLPCEFGMDRRTVRLGPIGNAEASWIIRHGIITPESRRQATHEHAD